MSWIRNRPLGIVLRVQLFLTLAMTSVLVVLSDLHSAISAMLGGMVSLISSAVFAIIISHHKGYTAGEAIRTAVRAELIKISLIVILLGIVFKSFENINPFAFIGTFILTVLAHSMALFVSDRNIKNKIN